ncbi:MAG: protein kinase [Phycisphaerales bacterium]
MTDPDDRDWKAEQMLEAVVTPPDDGSSSTRDRVHAYFDRLESSRSGDATTSSSPVEQAAHRTSPAPFPEAPPVAIPNHELLRCLGVGGFGQVWLARHSLTEHHRACKLVPVERAVELEGLKRLRQRVPPHPGLFPIEDVGLADGWLCCVMPLADPATTDQAVLDHTSYEPLTLKLHLERHGRCTKQDAASIALEIASATRHLHEHGVTHGDIKPGNILRLAGRWTLADYGLARDLSAPTGDGYTPAYSPPEGPGSTAADQFAIGVVLMELLSGWRPEKLADFRAATMEQLRLSEEFRGLLEVARRATEPEPESRFGSVGELADALRPLTGADDRPIRPQRGRMLAAATIALAAILLTIVVANSMRAPAPPEDAGAVASTGPLVESFQVRHYRYVESDGTLVEQGAMFADARLAPTTSTRPRIGDDVTVHARLAAPTYLYLVSLDIDGQVRLRVPASADSPPASVERLDYPSDPFENPDGLLYNLSGDPGSQGFMLLASREPLPSWSEWVASRGEPTWERDELPEGAVLIYDGADITVHGETREPMARRGQIVRRSIDWVRDLDGVIDARFVAFPVRPQTEK